MSEGLTLAKLIAAKAILYRQSVPTNCRRALAYPLADSSPWSRTAHDWARNPREKPLAFYETAHKATGFVFATPAFYVMGRPVRKYAPLEQILDVTHVFDFATCDTWYVFLMCGSVKQAFNALPWEMPFICWQRDNDPSEELRFYETRRVMRLAGVET